MKKPTCLSLFSGCGGLDLGLIQAGFEIVGATDSDGLCEVSHKQNFAKVNFLRTRIGDLTREAALALAKCKRPGQLDLLAGGPPCQPFSKSRFYRKEKPRSLADPNCNETIMGYLNVLRWLRPKAFMIENVKGLAYRKHRDALERIINVASGLGYNVEIKILNAADFGVPQIRERCFVVGTLSGVFSFPLPTHSEFGAGRLKKWTTAGEAIKKFDTAANRSDAGHRAGGRHHDLLRQIPPGQNYLFFTKERGHRNPKFKWRSRYWSFLLKLSPHMPSWTIQARRSNNMGPLHWRNRMLRIEEIKSLQTFPADWYLAGRVEEQWKQIGNAVPPLLANKVATALFKHLRLDHTQRAPRLAA